MRILVDENIPSITVQALKGMGHDLIDLRGTEFEGIDDERLWAMTQQERCLLVTTDKGFTRYRQARHFGILIVLLSRANRDRIHLRVMQAFAEYAEPQWRGRVVVMRDVAQATWLAPDES